MFWQTAYHRARVVERIDRPSWAGNDRDTSRKRNASRGPACDSQADLCHVTLEFLAEPLSRAAHEPPGGPNARLASSGGAACIALSRLSAHRGARVSHRASLSLSLSLSLFAPQGRKASRIVCTVPLWPSSIGEIRREKRRSRVGDLSRKEEIERYAVRARLPSCWRAVTTLCRPSPRRPARACCDSTRRSLRTRRRSGEKWPRATRRSFLSQKREHS